MKKIIILSSVLLASSLFASKLTHVPMATSELAYENGGNLPAIDSYKNGTGIVAVGVADRTIDNAPMNQLVFKHGDNAKSNASNLKDYVTNLPSASSKENELANNLGNLTDIPPSTIGASCNDGNPNTFNDVYVDRRGTCMGVSYKTCSELLATAPSTPNGTYTLDVDGSGPLPAAQFYCDMTGGGWTKFTGLVTGFDGFPGDNSSRTTNRVPASIVEMYKGLANASLQEKIIMAGASESCCDPYGIKSFGGATLFSTKGAYSNTLTFPINNSYLNAFSTSFISTDVSVNGGGGFNLSVDYVWFK